MKIKINFFLMFIYGTLISISSFNLMSMWMGLEINLISYIAYIISKKNYLSSESSIIYFLTQTVASIVLLFSFFMILMYNKFMILAISSIMMKIGSAPLHFWLPLTMQGLSWINNFILMTWQKIAPMIIFSFFYFYNILYLFISLSCIMSAVLCFNQTSLKKMIAFSSINQTTWLLISILKNIFIWKIYFLFYIIISSMPVLILKMFNLKNLNELYNINWQLKISSFFNYSILSMGGLPPFLGFFPKLMIIKIINNSMILFIIIISTLIMLFYYTRIMINQLLIFKLYKTSPMKKKMNMNYLMIFFYFINISGFLYFTNIL